MEDKVDLVIKAATNVKIVGMTLLSVLCTKSIKKSENFYLQKSKMSQNVIIANKVIEAK